MNVLQRPSLAVNSKTRRLSVICEGARRRILYTEAVPGAKTRRYLFTRSLPQVSSHSLDACCWECSPGNCCSSFAPLLLSEDCVGIRQLRRSAGDCYSTKKRAKPCGGPRPAEPRRTPTMHAVLSCQQQNDNDYNACTCLGRGNTRHTHTTVRSIAVCHGIAPLMRNVMCGRRVSPSCAQHR